MSNETKSAILNFAKKHHDFNIDDLFEDLSKSMNINSSSLLWHLFKLVNSNVLIRTSHGMYAKVKKPIFSPKPADDIIEVPICCRPTSHLLNSVSIKVKSLHSYNMIFHPTA